MPDFDFENPVLFNMACYYSYFKVVSPQVSQMQSKISVSTY